MFIGRLYPNNAPARRDFATDSLPSSSPSYSLVLSPHSPLLLTGEPDRIDRSKSPLSRFHPSRIDGSKSLQYMKGSLRGIGACNSVVNPFPIVHPANSAEMGLMKGLPIGRDSSNSVEEHNSR